MEKKSKIGRKIVVMLVAFTMLFSVALFSGCTNDNSDVLNELAQLRELLEEKSGLSQQLQELTELVNGMKGDNEGLEEKIGSLIEDIAGFNDKLKGLGISNEYLLKQVEGLQEQVGYLRDKLEAMKNNEDEFPFRLLFSNVNMTTIQNFDPFQTIVQTIVQWNSLETAIRVQVPLRFIEQSLSYGNSVIVIRWGLPGAANWLEEIELNRNTDTLTVAISVWHGDLSMPTVGFVVLEVNNSNLEGISNLAIKHTKGNR